MIAFAIALVAALGSSPKPAAAQGLEAGTGPCIDELTHTGGPQEWVVPRGVTHITINAWGAQGGEFLWEDPELEPTLGGRGGSVLGTVVPVNPGDQVEALVGGRGEDATVSPDFGVVPAPAGAGGFGGGGNGGTGTVHGGGGGGGASTVLINGQEVVIAGGGGGGAHVTQGEAPSSGGDGGLNGEDGTGDTTAGDAQPGLGATTTAGGAGGAGDGPLGTNGTNGAAQQGGTGGDGGFPSTNASDGGGGGGGGVFGGGGGGGGDFSTGSGATGGGGSSMGQPDSTFETGVKEGDGAVEIIRRESQCRNPKLVLKKKTPKDNVRPGEVVPYRITVRNKGVGQALNVRVCDKLPKGLKLLRAPKAVKTTNRRACWKLDRLGPGKKRTFRVTAQVKNSVRGGKLPNRATVKGCNGNRRCKDRDKEKVKVKPPVSICAAWKVSASC